MLFRSELGTQMRVEVRIAASPAHRCYPWGATKPLPRFPSCKFPVPPALAVSTKHCRKRWSGRCCWYCWLITPGKLPSAPSSHPCLPLHLLLSIAGEKAAKGGVVMAQPWGKMSYSPVGKDLICFASPVPRTLGKARGFWAGASFKGERS